MCPDIARTLDVKKSGVTADELTVGSNRRLWWRCPDHPDLHPEWRAVVNNRTGGSGLPRRSHG
ncbi:zinc-ribbon domain-containing protein [Streptomyces goshikiensis]|uniref:zinc-ribbon domain-containing protein n=1 Tax=Streptomyces goshikiensis TaxID=1942 RepID=UPI0036C3460C